METIINLAKMLFAASHNHTTLRPSSRYHSTNIRGRVIEVVEKFGDYIKSINNNNTVLLTTNTRTIAYIKLKKNNLLINEQILNDLITKQIIVPKIFENKDYYCIQGQLIPF